MTPYEIDLLLKFYAYPKPLDKIPDTDLRSETILKFLHEEILLSVANDEPGEPFRLSKRGNALVHRLMNVQFPLYPEELDNG